MLNLVPYSGHNGAVFPDCDNTFVFLISSPQLHYLRLPKDISEDYVILMDSTVSTGAAALMAIRVLLVGLQL